LRNCVEQHQFKSGKENTAAILGIKFAGIFAKGLPKEKECAIKERVKLRGTGK
jgi:hypothetical protein